MPRPGPRRPLICIRLGEAETAEIDELAESAGVNRSEMIRRLLIYAVKAHRPRTENPNARPANPEDQS